MEAIPTPNRRYIKRREAEHFWQFQFENEPIKESRSFRDKEYGSKEEALSAACKYRDEFFLAAQDLGVIEADGRFYIRPLPIQLTISPRNKSGIIGVAREVSTRKKGANPEKVWLANFKTPDGKNDQKSYSINALGERGALLAALGRRIEFVKSIQDGLRSDYQRGLVTKHVEEVTLLWEHLEALVSDDEVFVLLSLINNPMLSATEKHQILAIRIGQQRFRKMVLARCEDRCVVTGATSFLTAGHIKPWSESNDYERLDPHNGLALSPVYDKAFDAGLITFDNAGMIIVSARLARDAAALGITGRECLRKLSLESVSYLEYHRAHRYLE